MTERSKAGDDHGLPRPAGSERPDREFPGDSEVTVRQLRSLMQQFVSERGWEHFHNGKNLAMSLAIEAGELMEHFQWLTTAEVVEGTRVDRQGVEEELADVVCYALSLANALDIDLSQAIARKMIKNRLKYPAPGDTSH